jgi:hypothetical protein
MTSNARTSRMTATVQNVAPDVLGVTARSPSVLPCWPESLSDFPHSPMRPEDSEASYFVLAAPKSVRQATPTEIRSTWVS